MHENCCYRRNFFFFSLLYGNEMNSHCPPSYIYFFFLPLSVVFVILYKRYRFFCFCTHEKMGMGKEKSRRIKQIQKETFLMLSDGKFLPFALNASFFFQTKLFITGTFQATEPEQSNNITINPSNAIATQKKEREIEQIEIKSQFNLYSIH